MCSDRDVLSVSRCDVRLSSDAALSLSRSGVGCPVLSSNKVE